MSTIDDGGPAFPCAVFNADTDSYEDVSGISVRDYMAAKAMQALITEPSWPSIDYSLSTDIMCNVPTGSLSQQDHYATAAYILADAMLRARGVKA